VRRELEIALRARPTWLVAAIGSLLIGHGFVLALDLYSASSRSALSSVLQMEQMDPLAGIVRPTLGGVSLALSVLGPVIAARALAIEKERKTYGALCLAVGSSTRVIIQKAIASAAACGLLLLGPVTLFVALRAAGGHLDASETALALAGEALHLGLVVALATAAAACTRTFAQAVTLGILASLTSWAIDAAEGFAALAWLGGASAWSVEQRLLPFQHGVLSVSSVLWLLCASAIALAVAAIAGSFAPVSRKLWGALSIIGAGVLALLAIGVDGRALDLSEQRRASLPPDIVAALRRLSVPIAVDVFLDRDDSRRRQLERDVLAKLRLARPDIPIRMPLDEATEVAEGQHGGDDAQYGRVVAQAGATVRETRSSSAREIVRVLFEAAAEEMPAWAPLPYPGFPIVAMGARRRVLVLLAYVGLPSCLVLIGLALTHGRTTR
jgi:ABC-type transport system involved in multi-copper enzyme maturation permease subunit